MNVLSSSVLSGALGYLVGIRRASKNRNEGDANQAISSEGDANQAIISQDSSEFAELLEYTKLLETKLNFQETRSIRCAILTSVSDRTGGLSNSAIIGQLHERLEDLANRLEDYIWQDAHESFLDTNGELDWDAVDEFNYKFAGLSLICVFAAQILDLPMTTIVEVLVAVINFEAVEVTGAIALVDKFDLNGILPVENGERIYEC